MMEFLALSVLAYVAGSVNFAILLFRARGLGDPRDAFSGNPGVTNVYRQAGIFWACLVLMLDIARAMVVAFAAIYYLDTDQAPLIAFFLVAGNRFPCFHGFRGGKGVANYFGFTMVVSPLDAAFSAAAWLIVYAIARKPFIASFFMVVVLAAGMIACCGHSLPSLLGTAGTAALIVHGHLANMKSLMAGGTGQAGS